MKIKDKVFVLTGAGSGMGREMTKLLVSKGAKVAMVDISEKGLSETELIVGPDNVSKHILNTTVREDVYALPEAIIKKHKVVDALINNAGIIQPFVPINELDYTAIERVMNVNFYGTLYMTKAFLPYLLKRPEAHITNMSSMGGFIPFPGQTLYSASKAAVKILTEGLYSEIKDTNVGVMVVHPGAVNTNIMANSGVTMAKTDTAQEQSMKTLSAEAAAKIIIEGIEKNKFRVLVGRDAKMLDLMYRLSPKRAVDMIGKKVRLKFKV